MNDELRLSYVFLSLTAVNCGNLTDPANGQVNHTSGTTFRENATYSCNTGYNLVGDSTRTCQAAGIGLGVHLPVQVFRHIHKKHVNMYLAIAYLVEFKLYGRV